MSVEVGHWVSAGRSSSLKGSACLLSVNLGGILCFRGSNLEDVGENVMVFLARRCRDVVPDLWAAERSSHKEGIKGILFPL